MRELVGTRYKQRMRRVSSSTPPKKEWTDLGPISTIIFQSLQVLSYETKQQNKGQKSNHVLHEILSQRCGVPKCFLAKKKVLSYETKQQTKGQKSNHLLHEILSYRCGVPKPYYFESRSAFGNFFFWQLSQSILNPICPGHYRSA